MYMMEQQQQQLEQSFPLHAAAPSSLYYSSLRQGHSSQGTPSVTSDTGVSSSWTRNLGAQSVGQEDPGFINAVNSNYGHPTSGFGISPRSSQHIEHTIGGSSAAAQNGVLGFFAKGIVDSSKNAVRAVQVKARHMVSQNKRRYQEGGFDLDLTYITENIIAMGFPAGDMSSGFLGYFEGFYRNHMEEVIRFFETHHKEKYKVYNLCSERLYDASLFEGKVACFPFDDHNCPPIHLIISFCRSAYSWLKEGIENVVVVHCKAGKARTGLMISSLLLYLKFFPTAEESIEYYNQKRCVDGKGLVLPSQIRYVKYFEHNLMCFNGENQQDRRCKLKGFRFHKCPYWVRPSITISDHNGVLFSTKEHPNTKDLMPEDFWLALPKMGIVVFALPSELGLTELAGDFKIHFHDGQGDFYCWLNTTMLENRKILSTSDLDGFDKRKLPSPGFLVEVVMANYDEYNTRQPVAASVMIESNGDDTSSKTTAVSSISTPGANENPRTHDKDDVFSDSEAEESQNSTVRHENVIHNGGRSVVTSEETEVKTPNFEAQHIPQGIRQVSLNPETKVNEARYSNDSKVEGQAKSTSVLIPPGLEYTTTSDFKAISADFSVFSVGDDDDFESD